MAKTNFERVYKHTKHAFGCIALMLGFVCSLSFYSTSMFATELGEKGCFTPPGEDAYGNKLTESTETITTELETESVTEAADSFSYLYEAEEQKDSLFKKRNVQDLSSASKLYFSSWSGQQMVETDPIKSLENTPMIGVDLKTGSLYVGIKLNKLDDVDPQTYMTQEQIKDLLAILEDEQVQKWKKDYSNMLDDQIMDGLSWSLAISFEDGSVEKHHGYGVMDRNAPKNFSQFEEKITSFAAEVLKGNPQNKPWEILVNDPRASH